MRSDSQGCRRCGSCCLQGGPALHSADLALLRHGHLQMDDLITIREGELAFPPLSSCPVPVSREFLKLRGKGNTWACFFFDEKANGCLRYDYRPVACKTLDCQDTGPLLDLAGKDLLSRFDCLDPHDPFLPFVLQHTEECPCPDLLVLNQRRETGGITAEVLAGLQAAVQRDLAFRSRVTAQHNLSLRLELFYFGRPLFQLVQQLGIMADTSSGGVRLVLPGIS